MTLVYFFSIVIMSRWHYFFIWNCVFVARLTYLGKKKLPVS